MKKAVLREYLKNREEKTLTIDRDKFFTLEVEDVDLTDSKDTFGEIIRKAAKDAVEQYEKEIETLELEEVKPKKKAKKGEK